MSEKKVTIIKGQEKKTDEFGRKIRLRVAAYCRVSTDGEDQLKSYRSQVQYYTDKIRKCDDWIFVGIYADEGISGTASLKRPEFMKMIADCEADKIDLILTKSLSRFSRNTYDTLKYVRKLKENNVSIIFEEENINTLTMSSEFFLTVLGAIYQQEVYNISSHVKAGLRMKMKRGEIINGSCPYGYDYDHNTKNLVINEDEAKVIRQIFAWFIEGITPTYICRKLNEMKIPTPGGLDIWNRTYIQSMVKNIKYTGVLLQGKCYTESPLTKKKIVNYGEKEVFMHENHHEAIISKEDFDKANEILSSRRTLYNQDQYCGKHRDKSIKHTFTRKIKCFFCGKHYTRSFRPTIINWVPLCRTSISPNENCNSIRQIRESLLEDLFVQSYNKMCEKNGHLIDDFMLELGNCLNAPQEKIINEIKQIDNDISELLDVYLEKTIEKTDLKDAYEGLLKKKLALQEKLNSQPRVRDIDKRLKKIKNFLQKEPCLKKFNPDIFSRLVDQVIIGGMDSDNKPIGNKVTFVYKSGDKDEHNIGTSSKRKSAPLQLNSDLRASESGISNSSSTLSWADSKPLKRLSCHTVNIPESSPLGAKIHNRCHNLRPLSKSMNK